MRQLSPSELRSLAAHCGGVMVLLFAALFVGQGGLERTAGLLSTVTKTSQAQPVITRSGDQVTVAFTAPANRAAANTATVASYTSSNSWIAPTGVTSATVTVVGGGGGAGGASWSNCNIGDAVAGGGGGSGGYVNNQTVSITPGWAYTVTVGAGGAGGAYNGCGGYSINGTAGNNSSFGGIVNATAGGGGNTGNNGTSGQYPGGNPGSPNGTYGTPGQWGWCGANAGGNNGSGYGTGGSNSCNQPGGNGTNGYVSITYTQPPPTTPTYLQSGTCTVGAPITFGWGGSTNNTGYALRIDNTAVSCGGVTGGNNNVGCVSPTDYVENQLNNLGFTSRYITAILNPGTHHAWVHGVTSAGAWSAPRDYYFSCSCPSGQIQSGSSCVVASCTFNGSTVPNGSSVTAYSTQSVPYDNSCSTYSQTRTCSNGTLSGSYPYASCTVAPAANCTFNGSTVLHGNSVTAYQSSLLPYGQSCSAQSQARTCSNGTLSGTYAYPSCSNSAASTPTLTITGNGIATTISVIAGMAVDIAATFTAGAGDTITGAAINNYLNNALTSQVAASSKSYTFTPAAAGSYVFYPAVTTGAYPSWNNYSQALTVTATDCPTAYPAAYGAATVTGSDAGQIWGSGPYTYDSPAATAVIHQGLIALGQKADINRTSTGVTSGYTGTTQNGVTSTAWPDAACGVTLATVCVYGNSTCSADNTQALEQCNNSIVNQTCTASEYCPASGTGCINAQTGLSLNVSPSRVRRGGSVTITWSSNPGDTACVLSSTPASTLNEISGASLQTLFNFRGLNVTVNRRTTFTLTCETGTPQQKSVSILPGFIEI